MKIQEQNVSCILHENSLLDKSLFLSI